MLKKSRLYAGSVEGWIGAKKRDTVTYELEGVFAVGVLESLNIRCETDEVLTRSTGDEVSRDDVYVSSFLLKRK